MTNKWGILLAGTLIFTEIMLYHEGFKKQSFQDKIQKYEQTPIQIITQDNKGNPLDLNNDGTNDRIFKNEAGLYQEQFGYKNNNGETEYLTFDQISQRIRANNQNNLEKEMNKYKVKKN